MSGGQSLKRIPVAGLPRPYYFSDIPEADPRDATETRWHPTTGFENVPVPGTASSATPDARTGPTLDLASRLTAQARQSTKEGKEAEGIRLHVLAAELRREAGRWALCVENYDALTRHYLARRDLKPALAYMRRMAFVAEHVVALPVRIESHLLASEVYLAAGRLPSAVEAAGKAASLALAVGDPALHERSGAAIATADRASRTLSALAGKAGTCQCGGRLPCQGCHDAADGMPVEFSVRALDIPTSLSRPGTSPWWSSRSQGAGIMMDQPGDKGEPPYWISHGVSDGRHVLLALPNWPSRALNAAKMMCAYSLDHPDGTECPSSAVLQVVTALEAFINAAIHFIGLEGAEAWEHHEEMPSTVFNQGKSKVDGSVHGRWKDIGIALFGDQWEASARIADFHLLIEVRKTIVHFKGADAEQIGPITMNPTMRLFEAHDGFRNVPGAIRPGPLPWVDRILTPHFAGWAVALGEHMITTFRDAWNEQVTALSMHELRERLRDMEDCLRHPPKDEAADGRRRKSPRGGV